MSRLEHDAGQDETVALQQPPHKTGKIPGDEVVMSSWKGSRGDAWRIRGSVW